MICLKYCHNKQQHVFWPTLLFKLAVTMMFGHGFFGSSKITPGSCILARNKSPRAAIF